MEIKQLEGMVAGDIEREMRAICKGCEGSVRASATSMAEMAETVDMALSKSKDAGAAQRRVILCVSGEAILECGRTFEEVGMLDDMDTDPRLADADDLVRSLAQYCDKKGIMRDPMTMPLKDIVSADEARLLCRQVEKAIDQL